MKKLKKTTLFIKGMHCPSCNILVKDKFLNLKNIKKVRADFKTQKAEVYFQGKLDLQKLDKLISPFGYSVIKNRYDDSFQTEKKDWLGFLLILVGLIFVYIILKKINLLPNFNYNNLSLITIFLLGIVASLSTCMATTGVLYLTISREKNHLWTAFSFSLGRVLSYGFFGFILGFLGKQLTTNIFFSGFLSLIISLTMIFLGLDLAKIISWSNFFGSINTGSIFEFLKEKLNRYPRRFPFLIGAITYLLPCGFTQSIQVYSIGIANPILSALNMMVFAIGTVPLILLINQAIRIRQMNFYQYFLKFTGVLVFLIGLTYFVNFLSLFNISLFNRVLLIFSQQDKSSAQFVNRAQEIKMTVNASGYQPTYLKVKKDIPVRWLVNGENVLGCQGYLVVPKLGIAKALNEGLNVFEFTPKETGLIGFSCGMGMYRGFIEVVN